MCSLGNTNFCGLSQDVLELFPCSETAILFFFLSFPSVLQLHRVGSLWFYEWNVMICICIKVLSLDAPSALKTFMEVNLGKKFSVIYVTFSFHCTSAVPDLCEKLAQNILFIRICTLIIHTDKTITMYSFCRGRAVASQPKLHHGTKHCVSESGIDITHLQHFLRAFPVNLPKNQRHSSNHCWLCHCVLPSP